MGRAGAGEPTLAERRASRSPATTYVPEANRDDGPEDMGPCPWFADRARVSATSRSLTEADRAARRSDSSRAREPCALPWLAGRSSGPGVAVSACDRRRLSVAARGRRRGGTRAPGLAHGMTGRAPAPSSSPRSGAAPRSEKTRASSKAAPSARLPAGRAPRTTVNPARWTASVVRTPSHGDCASRKASPPPAPTLGESGWRNPQALLR